MDVFDAMWKNQAEGGFGDYLSIVVSHLEQSSSRGNVLEEILLRNRVRFFLQADEPSLRSDRLQAGLAQFMEKEEQLKALPRTGVAELIHYLRSVAGEDTNIPFANTDSFLVQYSRRAADLPKKDRLLWAYRLIVAKQTMIDCRREAIHEEWTRLIDEFVGEAQLQEGIPDKWIAIASFIRVLWATYTFKYAVADQEAARSQYHSTVLEGLACSFNGFKAEFDTIGIEDETLAFFSEFCKAVEAFKHVWLPVQLATHQHPLFEPEQMDEIIMRIGDK